MLSAAKVPLFFWAEAIATGCYTQNHSLVIPCHEKTPYHIINDQKPSVKFFYIFGSVCYIVRDGENLDKMKEKGDECIFVGYSNQSRAYRIFNKRTRVIMEYIHVNFDELPQMASDQLSFDPAPEYKTVTTSNELDLLFSLMFDEFLNGSSKVVSKFFAVSAADDPYQHQHYTTPLNNHITPAPTSIAISCNPVRHSRTKYIDVRYHFIKEKVEKGIVELFFVETEYQLADLFNKALSVERFQYLVRRLGMRCLTLAELEALVNESA
nr:hypothetical protein [Tanacetum cinerariifolium]